MDWTIAADPSCCATELGVETQLSFKLMKPVPGSCEAARLRF